MKSDYDYSVETVQGKNCIIITDLDQGNTSVTNNIDNVIEEIARIEEIDPAEHLIVYRDSTKTWDGYDYTGRNFVALNAHSSNMAISRYIKLQEEKVS